MCNKLTPDEVLIEYDKPGINSLACDADGVEILAEALRKAIKQRDECKRNFEEAEY